MKITSEMKTVAMMILNDLKAQNPELIDDNLYAIARDKIMAGNVREKTETETELEVEGR